MNERKLRQLTELSKEARQLLTKMIGQIGVGHVGGSLSLIEALVYLYYEEMRVRPEEPGWPDRDRIVLSKGHAGPALYTLLAMKGYFDKETLLTLNQPGTRLPSHCDMKLTTGIDMTAGSLGQGLSAAVGMALAARMERKDYRVYCIVGDGEQQEGQIWEAAMYAGSQELDNLVVLVDERDADRRLHRRDQRRASARQALGSVRLGDPVHRRAQLLGSRSRADPCPHHQEAPHRHHHGHGRGQRAFGRGRQAQFAQHAPVARRRRRRFAGTPIRNEECRHA